MSPRSGGSGNGNALRALGSLRDVWIVLLVGGLSGLCVLFPPGVGLRIPAGVILLLVLPGYAVTTAVFPARSRKATGGTGGTEGTGPAALTDAERAALSFGLSLAIAPLLGVVLGATDPTGGVGSLRGLLEGLAVVILLATGLGTVRRLRTPAADRYDLPLGRWFSHAASWVHTLLTGEGDRPKIVLNLVLAGTVLLAAGAFGFALAFPQDGSSYTSVSLLSDTTAADGGFAASNYTTTFEPGENATYRLEITNREGERTTYTVLVRIQNVSESGVVREAETLGRVRNAVGSGETWRFEHEVSPGALGTGDRLRLAYLVYRGPPPDDPTTENAYRHVTLWVDVVRDAEDIE